MTQDTMDKCKACKHHWAGQCCNVYAQVQQAWGTLGDCRFHAEMPHNEIPANQRPLKLAS